MYFDLTDDQKAIRDEIVGMLGDHLSDDRLVPAFNDGQLDQVLFDKLNEMGLNSILVDEAAGGLGLGLLTLAVVAEAIGAAGAAVPTLSNALGAWLVAGRGSEAQRDRWLAGLLDGSVVAAFALRESGGWQPDDWRIDGPLASGVKHYVEWGSEADLLIVGLSDGTLGLVDARAVGVTRDRIDAVDRNRPIADIHLDNVDVDRIGDRDASCRLRDALLTLLAADACGAGNRALAMAVEYAKIRTQFDQLIGSFQGLKHQLANMAAEMLPCRQLYWYAAYTWDALPAKSGHAAAIAKAHVTEVAVNTARRAVEAHGGIGYTWEYPLHIFLKRAMFDREAMGAPMLHRARAAELAGW